MSIINRTTNFFHEVKKELGKVAFLSKEDLMKHTLSVILVSLGFAAFLGGIDYVFIYLIKTFLLKI